MDHSAYLALYTPYKIFSKPRQPSNSKDYEIFGGPQLKYRLSSLDHYFAYHCLNDESGTLLGSHHLHAPKESGEAIAIFLPVHLCEYAYRHS